MLVGELIIGFLCALPTYFFTKRTIAFYRKKQQKRSDRIDFIAKTA